MVAIEILAISIRSDTNIKGIRIGDNETKLLAYADDMTALLSDIPSVKKLLDSLNAFEKWSGLKMNVSKTKAMWIGTMKNSPEKPLGLEEGPEGGGGGGWGCPKSATKSHFSA